MRKVFSQRELTEQCCLNCTLLMEEMTCTFSQNQNCNGHSEWPTLLEMFSTILVVFWRRTEIRSLETCHRWFPRPNCHSWLVCLTISSMIQALGENIQKLLCSMLPFQKEGHCRKPIPQISRAVDEPTHSDPSILHQMHQTKWVEEITCNGQRFSSSTT